MSKTIEHLEALKHDVNCLKRIDDPEELREEIAILIDSRISDIEHDEMIEYADKAWRER